MPRSLAQSLALRQQVEDELEGLKETDWTPSNLLELPGGWSFRDSQPEVDTRKRTDRLEAEKKARHEAQAVRRCACGASLANKKTAKAFRCDDCAAKYRREAARLHKEKLRATRPEKLKARLQRADAARERALRRCACGASLAHKTLRAIYCDACAEKVRREASQRQEERRKAARAAKKGGG